jgi:HAT1-interacting factor 1
MSTDNAQEAEQIAANSDSPAETSAQDQLADLVAKATAEYAVKHYSEAAELFSQAAELQTELNGEMAPENADLLYSYGKCLYFLAQQTSSVLGGTAASAQLSSSKEKKAPKKRKANGTTHAESSTNGQSSKSGADKPADTVPNVGDVMRESDVKPGNDAEGKSDKPYFQISGDDAGWDESDESDADKDPEAEEEEEEDDFATAYELLDLARVLYLKKLDQAEESALKDSDKGKYIASIDLTPEVKELKARVADIYDLQAEVSLEGEKYSAAVTDLKACLALREELEPPESSILAECHYKLSLGLEFSSQSQQRDQDGNPVGEISIDWEIRNEAVAQQEKAIDCCKLRVAKETKALETLEAGPQKDKAMAQVEDVQEMIGEMDVRLAELRKPPVNVKAETEEQMVKEQISGVLGSLLGSGATEEQKKEKLAQVSETANDLSGLVKRKKPKGPQASGGDSGFGSSASTPAAAPPALAEGSSSSSAKPSKRKVNFVDEVEDVETGKKAKVEDAEDSGL